MAAETKTGTTQTGRSMSREVETSPLLEEWRQRVRRARDEEPPGPALRLVVDNTKDPERGEG